MSAAYKHLFRKFVKKQSRPFQLAIEDEVEKVTKDPCIGVSKKGDISDFKVLKFKFQGQKFLMAYGHFQKLLSLRKRAKLC